MRRPVTFALALLALFFSYWFWPQEVPHAASEASHVIASKDASLSRDAPDGEVALSGAATGEVDKQDNTRANSAALAETDASHPLVEPEIQDQIRTVMQSYAEISRYPPHSQPIKSEAHMGAFVNASLPEAEFPFELSGSDTPVHMALQLAAYQFFPGDRIEGDLRVYDLPEGATVTPQAQVQDITGSKIADVMVQTSRVQGDEQRYALVLNSIDYTVEDWPQELVIAANVEVNGEALFISVPLRFNAASAVITGLGYSQPVAESLQIPVRMNVLQPGYYHLAGILYNRDASRPLVHLEAEGALAQGEARLIFKAHIQALKTVADEGPYVLSDLRLTRWADEQHPLDLAGKVEDGVFIVQGFPFSHYEDKPYIDPLQAERQALMEGLSQL